MAIGPDRNTLYVGFRTQPSIASYRIDPATGGLSLSRTAAQADAQADAPTFLAPDCTGGYMLCAYYQGGYVAVFPIAADGTIGTTAIDKQTTAVGAHAIATDLSNRFAFVPHIARIQDNVLEPPKNNPGPNVILQYRFDAQTGRLSPNTPQRVEQGDLVGPRHYIRHPSLDVVYFSNEQGCSVTPSMSLVAKQSGQPLLNHRQSPHYARDDDRERITSARQAAEALFTPKPQPVEPSASDPAPSAERPARKPRVLSILSPAVAKPRHNRRSS